MVNHPTEFLAPGTRLDRYEIQHQLGRGGMATVYLAQDPRHHRSVAIKVLHTELARTIGPERFLREIEVAAHLQHPHILPLIDSGQAEGRLYYVMPFVEGESLRQRLLQVKQLPVDASVRIAREVAEALDYAHRHGVIHRDIKPENILLADGQAVIADFGIARALSSASNESITQTGLVLGTPAYMSPEQATGAASLDGRTDVYSLGCVMYEVLAGQPPFTGPTVESVIHQHLAGEPPALPTLRPGVSQELAHEIARAMAKTPADRFQSAGRFAEELARLQVTDFSAAPVTRPRRRWIAAAALAALVTLGAIASVLFRPKPLPLDPSLLAVAPFDVLDPALGLWHEGLVDYLSRNLDGAGSLRTVSPTIVIRRWSGRADAASARELGRRTGAKLVVVGQLLGAGAPSVRLRGTLVDAGSGKVLGEFDRSDRSARVDRLADSLTVDLLRELARTRPGTPVRFASVGTGSLLALKSFLQGEQFFRRTVWDSAVVHYERAVTLDTTFALAIWRLASARAWAGVAGEVAPLWLRAGRFNHGLAPHDSLLLTADSVNAAFFDTLDPGYWSHLLRSLSTLEEGTRRYPDDPEMWYQLGEARFHDGIVVGSTAQQILSTFDRAITLDPNFGPAYIHPISLALDSLGPGAAMRYIEGYLATASEVEEGVGIRLIASLLQPRSAAQFQALTDTVSVATLVGAYERLAGWTDSNETATRLARLLSQRQGSIPGSLDTTYYRQTLASVLAYRGHLHEARAALGNRFHYLFAELALLGVVPVDTADAVIAHWLESFDSPALRLGTDDRCRRSLGAVLWWAARRDSARLRDLMRWGTRAAAAPTNVYQRGLAEADIVLARTGLALARRDTADALRNVTAFPDSLCPRFLPRRLLQFQLLADAGRDVEAAALFDRIPATDPEMLFSAVLGVARLSRARVAERLHDRATAIRYYQRVLDTWRHADPELRPYVEEARAGLARTSGELRN